MNFFIGKNFISNSSKTYFVADIAGDFATGGNFSRVRKVVLK
jgi:hypothetical protein